MIEPRKIRSHGTAVALPMAGGQVGTVLLRGRPGSGKSDLAFRLIEELGGTLVGDDQVTLEWRHEQIVVSCEDTIKGMLEIRGVGLIKLPSQSFTKLVLIVDLVESDKVPRMPEWEKEQVLGVAIPRLKLNSFEVSTARKVFKSMEAIYNPGILIS